jgi:glycosyltransferase involved in cell wall biosynthesis
MVGSGPHPREFPSGSGYFIQDLLVKGLAELGHDVFYLSRDQVAAPLPAGATWVSEPIPDADILHAAAYHDEQLLQERESSKQPWVTTCHIDREVRGTERSPTTENWIFVSRTLAELHGRSRFVLNGIDPSQYIFSETKDDYLLFMSAMDWGIEKGLEVALSLSQQVGFKLVVAGTGTRYDIIETTVAMCREANAEYVGDVRGQRKAELLAGAKAFLFPTKVNEAFGLGMVEALMSGTPVICSDKGACPEIISPDVGFVCSNENDYLAAIRAIGDISSRACRDKAMRDYHYLRMAADYIVEYQKEIGGNGKLKKAEAG